VPAVDPPPRVFAIGRPARPYSMLPRMTRRHDWVDDDLVYTVRVSTNRNVRESAEELQGRFSNVAVACAGYFAIFARRRRSPADNVRRYFHEHGATGPLRRFLYRFLDRVDRDLLLNAPEEQIQQLISHLWAFEIATPDFSDAETDA
jgi:hypothetical protein